MPQTLSKWLPWLVIILLLLVSAILWRPIVSLFSQADAQSLQQEVDQLGVLGPLGLVALSIIQIVGAPIPGYPVQLLGGALFGTWIGGIYSVIGMALGGMIAAWLARRLGRPFIEKQVGVETLRKYESLAQLQSLWVWVIILTIPLGDFPYYIAGLSQVKYRILLLAILISRGPFTFVISWVGSTSVEAPTWMIWTIFGLILLIVLIGYLSKDRIQAWLDRTILPRLE